MNRCKILALLLVTLVFTGCGGKADGGSKDVLTVAPVGDSVEYGLSDRLDPVKLKDGTAKFHGIEFEEEFNIDEDNIRTIRAYGYHIDDCGVRVQLTHDTNENSKSVMTSSIGGDNEDNALQDVDARDILGLEYIAEMFPTLSIDDINGELDDIKLLEGEESTLDSDIQYERRYSFTKQLDDVDDIFILFDLLVSDTRYYLEYDLCDLSFRYLSNGMPEISSYLITNGYTPAVTYDELSFSKYMGLSKVSVNTYISTNITDISFINDGVTQDKQIETISTNLDMFFDMYDVTSDDDKSQVITMMANVVDDTDNDEYNELVVLSDMSFDVKITMDVAEYADGEEPSEKDLIRRYNVLFSNIIKEV